MEKITGSYNPFEGRVTNPISNMKASDVRIDYSTFIHEIQHLHFNLFFVIGKIIEVLRIERKWTPETDGSHRIQIEDTMNILCESFRGLQEIYANSMELLWLADYLGSETAALVYEKKSGKYKDYSRKFYGLIKENTDLEEKRQLIHRLCVQAAQPDMTEIELAELLTDDGRLKEYFKGAGNMEKRLERIIAEYSENSMADAEDRVADFEKLCACMIKNRILVYSKWLTDIGHRMADAVDETMLVRMMEEYYQEFLTEKTEVLDFELAGKSMDIYHVAWEEAYGCILKKHSRLLYPEENYLLMGCSDDGKYIGQEVSEALLSASVGKLKAVAVDFREFDIRKNCPMYFSAPEIPVFVLITNYAQCESWLEYIVDEDLYFVTFFPETVKNFYTVFFFRRRREPKVMFVYPALKVLARRLIDSFGLKEKVIFSTDVEALKFFAGLGTEVEMLHTLKWLFEFVSGTAWDGYHLQNPASMLCSGFIRPILDSALSIRKADYWKMQSALPTMETVSDGLYTLMEFKDGKNTGCICAQASGGKMYPMFFRNKSSAVNYQRKNSRYGAYRVVAVDDYYWKTLYEALSPDIRQWCLYMNEQQGILLDADVYSANFFDKL